MPRVNTLLPFGQVSAVPPFVADIHSVFGSGRPSSPEVVADATSGKPVIRLLVPVFSGAKADYVLALDLLPNFFDSIVTKNNLPSGWGAAVLDPTSTIAARTEDPEKYVGTKVLLPILQELKLAPEGRLKVTLLEGTPADVTYSRSPVTGWSVVVAYRWKDFDAELARATWQLGLGTAGLMLLGVLMAWWLGERISRSMVALQAPSHALEVGETVVMPAVFFREAEDLAITLTKTSALLMQRNQTIEANVAALTEREAELQSAQRLAHLGSWIWDADRHDIVSSHGLLDMLGLESLPPFSEQAGIVYPKQAWQQLNTAVQEAVRTGTGFDLVLPALRGDGTELWVNTLGVAVRDAHDKVIRVRVTVQDITRRRLIEIELDQHRHHLEELVRVRTAELHIAKDDADKANQAKSRFLAAASHDLRQPLSALSLYTASLSHTALASDREALVNMQACVDSLSELLTNLLDLSKLEAGVVVESASDFPVQAVFDRLASTYAPETHAKGLRLHIRPTAFIARTDPVLLQRILSNLLANATRYTERGGILVTCRRRQSKDWVEVWDTGIGIPVESQAEIFEAFKQLGDGARNNGSGLGLAIVAKTAALLGLKVSVRSWSGRGSVFAIELPRGVSDRGTPEALPTLALRPLRVALVEDNAMVREALVMALQGLGHQVLGAASAAALLPDLAQFQADIMVSDYRLANGETGLETVAVVRRRLGAAFPVVILTGDTDPALLRNIADSGVAVLHKPLALDALQARLYQLTSPESSRL